MPGSYLPVRSGKWSCVRSPCRRAVWVWGHSGSITFKGKHGEWSGWPFPLTPISIPDIIYSPTRSVCRGVSYSVPVQLCDPMYRSLTASIHMDSPRARRLEWLLLSSRESSQSPREALPQERIHVYVWLISSAVHLKLSQHCLKMKVKRIKGWFLNYYIIQFLNFNFIYYILSIIKYEGIHPLLSIPR